MLGHACLFLSVVFNSLVHPFLSLIFEHILSFFFFSVPTSLLCDSRVSDSSSSHLFLCFLYLQNFVWSFNLSFLFLLSRPHAASLSEYQSLVGESVSLPCNVSDWTSSSTTTSSTAFSSTPRSDFASVVTSSSRREMTPVSLVLWFKDQISSDTPIYTLDVRNQGSLSRSKHISSPSLKDRAYFDVSLFPPRLVINNITKSDQGLFRCRVDYRKAPTQNSFVNLAVTGKLTITDNTSCGVQSWPGMNTPFVSWFLWFSEQSRQ